MDWSLGLSLGTQDSTIFHAIDAQHNTFVWTYENQYASFAIKKPVFSVSGYKRESVVKFSLWLVPNQTSIGRLLCYTAEVPIHKLHLDYPTQMSVDAFRIKPRRNSLLFVDRKKTPKADTPRERSIELKTSAPELVEVDMKYQCRFSYKKSQSADMHAQLRVYCITVRLKDWGILLEYLRHDAGHRIVMMCNDTYLGAAQEITERDASGAHAKHSSSSKNPFEEGDVSILPQYTHRVYRWLPQKQQENAKEKEHYTVDEEYDRVIIEGFAVVESPRSALNDTKHSLAVGTLLSPRVVSGKIKTPRPMSHVQKTDIVQPPFVPDTVQKKNECPRLQSRLCENDLLALKVFNFRFTPPRFLSHKIQWVDFDAAYNRTCASSHISAINTSFSSKTEQRKSFSQKKKMKKKTKKKQEEEEEAQRKIDAQLVCRMERSIAPSVTLVVIFQRPCNEYVLIGEVLLEVNNFDLALQFEQNTKTH